MRLRTGRKVGRTIYVQEGEQPSDDDRLVGMMDTVELAEVLVEAYNAIRVPTEPKTSSSFRLAPKRPHRADGHACPANLPPPHGRFCNWCGAHPFVERNATHGPVERVAWGSERHQELTEREIFGDEIEEP